jgi:hypothetical protein
MDRKSSSRSKQQELSHDAGLIILICRKSERSLIAITSATTAPMSAAAAATISAAASAASALDLWTRFIHIQGASANLRAVQRRDGLLSVFRTRHLHEAEATRAPGIPVGHDADPVHLPMDLEQLAQFVFRSIEVEVPNENVLQANLPLSELFERGRLRQQLGGWLAKPKAKVDEQSNAQEV